MKRRIDISELSDFCFGVKRAISIAEAAIGKCPDEVFSLGPLIHNRQVVNELSEKGLKVAEGLGRIGNGTVVICSHGIAAGELDKIKKKKMDVVDATCPFVKNGQRIAKKLSGEGYKVIIAGDKGHPEVKSLKSFSGETAEVIATVDDARKLKPKKTKIGIIAQTTQSPRNFQNIIAELIKKDFSEIRVFNTVCGDTNMRQEAARRCAEDNDLIIVIGGKNSANTKRLYEICKDIGKKTYHIETGSEIKSEWLKNKKAVGVVSGASTPRWVVDGAVKRMKNIK